MGVEVAQFHVHMFNTKYQEVQSLRISTPKMQHNHDHQAHDKKKRKKKDIRFIMKQSLNQIRKYSHAAIKTTLMTFKMYRGDNVYNDNQ